MENIVVHIGLHKTATGTLQRQFFPACVELNLLTTLIPRVRNFIHYVTRCDPIYFDKNKAHYMIEPLLDKEKLTLISNESLSGPPFAGVIEGGIDHRSPVLKNLSTVFPKAKIILVLRRQDGLAKSFYRQYLKSGGTRKINRFYGMEGPDRLPLMSKDRFKYSIYIEEVIKLFPEGVLLLAFEEFVQDQTKYLTKITNFTGISLPDIELRRENITSLGPTGMEITRVLNHVFRSMLNPGGMIPGIKMKQHGLLTRVSPINIVHDKWPGKKSKLHKGLIFDVAQEILKNMKEDNEVIDKRYKLDLSKYNYY